MFELNQVRVDVSKLEGGVWWSVYRDPEGGIGGQVVKEPTEDGCLLIRQMDTAYERALERAREPYLAAIRAGRLTDDERVAIQAKALAGTVLVDWRNFTGGGKPVPFSVEKAEEILADKQWLAIREFVVRAAQHRGSVLAELDEQAQGN